jgi:hypothetical protein
LEVLLKSLDGPTPVPGPRELPEGDLRRYAEYLVGTTTAPVVLTLLEPGDEQLLGLGRIRLDPMGYLCDRVTGRDILPWGGERVSYRGFDIEQPSPDHYCIRAPENETVLLRYTHQSWYYRQETYKP